MGGNRPSVRCPHVGSERFRKRIALLLVLSAFVATPVAAQIANAPVSDTASKDPPPGLVTIPSGCVVVPHEEEDGTSSLFANCRGHGLILGRASTYQVLANEALGAWVVDMHLGTDRHVWLLSLQNDGQPLLEDISGQIARAAGKNLMANIEGLEIDFAGFARDGSIGVRADSSKGAAGKAVQMALGQQIARERSR